MSILLQSFATKQVQESPRDSESTGALMIGGEGEPHRLLPAPLALSANVFASVPAR